MLGFSGSGPIPAELANLTRLRELILRDPLKMNRSIPAELGNLTQLEVLDLRLNVLTGTLPPELSGLVNLDVLIVGDNQLTGCVPVELSELWVEASGLERCTE